MKISIWLYEDDSYRNFNTNVNISNFRIFHNRDMFKNDLGLLMYPKNYENITHHNRYPMLLKQNRRIFERFGNTKAIRYLEMNS